MTKSELINIRLEPDIKTDAEEVTQLASIIEATGGNGSVSNKNQRILELFANGDIDYETAVFAIKRNFAQ